VSVEGLSDIDRRWLIDKESEGSRLAFSLPGLPAEDQVEGLRRLGEMAAEGSPHETHVCALALCLVGEFEAGVELFESLVWEGPDRPEYRLNLALAYLHVGLPDLAFDHRRVGEPA